MAKHSGIAQSLLISNVSLKFFNLVSGQWALWVLTLGRLRYFNKILRGYVNIWRLTISMIVG